VKKKSQADTASPITSPPLVRVYVYDDVTDDPFFWGPFCSTGGANRFFNFNIKTEQRI